MASLVMISTAHITVSGETYRAMCHIPDLARHRQLGRFDDYITLSDGPCRVTIAPPQHDDVEEDAQ